MMIRMMNEDNAAQAPAGATRTTTIGSDHSELDRALQSTNFLSENEATTQRGASYGVRLSPNPFGVPRNLQYSATPGNAHGKVAYGPPVEGIQHCQEVAANFDDEFLDNILTVMSETSYIHIDPRYTGEYLYPSEVGCDMCDYRKTALPHIKLKYTAEIDTKCAKQDNCMYSIVDGEVPKHYNNTQPLVSLRCIAEHIRPHENGEDTAYIPKAEFWVLTPLFNLLKLKLSRARYEPNLLRGVYSLVGTLGIEVSMPLVQVTVDCWIAELRYLHSRTISAILDQKGTDNLRYVLYDSLEPELGKFIGVQEYHAPIIRSSVDYVGKMDYEFRDFKILGKYKHLNALKANEPVLYKETLWEALGKMRDGEKDRSPTHTTMFFELRGVHATFTEYTPNAHNRQFGAKRLLAQIDPKIKEQGEKLSQAMMTTLNPRMNDILKRREHLSANRLAKIHLEEATVVHDCETAEMVAFTKYLLRNFGYSYCRQMINLVDRSIREIYSAFLDGAIARLPVHSLRELYLRIRGPKARERDFMLANNVVHDENDILLKKATAEVKVEYAKPGKVPRLFVSMYVAFLYNFHIMFLVKLVLHGGHYITTRLFGKVVSGSVFILVKPQPNDLHSIFNMMCSSSVYINSPSIVAAVSGDDCIMNITDGVMTLQCNTDAIACDAHQGSLGFGILGVGTCAFDEPIGFGTVKQAMVPIQIGDVVVEMPDAALGSGNTATTTVNSITSALVVKATSIALAQHLTKDFLNREERQKSLIEVVQKGANMVGHEVTVEIAQSPHHYQFLKRSPFYDPQTCTWLPYLNMGAIFRKLGCLSGDMTSLTLGVTASQFRKMDHKARMEAYVGGVVAGLVNEPTNPIMAALRTRFPPVQGIVLEKSVLRQDIFTGEVTKCLSSLDNTDAIMHRYDLTLEDLRDFAQQLINLQVGQICTSRAMTAFLLVDYGLKPTSTEEKLS